MSGDGSFSTIKVTVDGQVATMALNRPAKSNALDMQSFTGIPRVRELSGSWHSDQASHCKH